MPGTLFAGDLAVKHVDVLSEDTTYLVFAVYLDGNKFNGTTTEQIIEIRNQLKTLDSNAKITWAMSSSFVWEETHVPQIELIKNYVDTKGDQIAYGISFANDVSDAELKTNFEEWLYMYVFNAFNTEHKGDEKNPSQTWGKIPERYRPTSVVTFSINNRQIDYFKDFTYGVTTNASIDVFMGWTNAQYKVGKLTAEGNILSPYYNHINNTLVPAQSIEKSSGGVVLNTLAIDPVGCRFIEGDSRFTIYPGDPRSFNGIIEQVELVKRYLDNPYKEKNTVNYIPFLIDINGINKDAKDKEIFTQTIDFLASRKGEICLATVKEFAEAWKKKVSLDNAEINYTLEFRGTGTQAGDGKKSDEKLTYLWTENRKQRIIIEKYDSDTKWKIIDFTDYTIENIPLLQNSGGAGANVDVSYKTGRNYRLNKDAPLLDNEIERIKERLKEIGFNEPVEGIEFLEDDDPGNNDPSGGSPGSSDPGSNDPSGGSPGSSDSGNDDPSSSNPGSDDLSGDNPGKNSLRNGSSVPGGNTESKGYSYLGTRNYIQDDTIIIPSLKRGEMWKLETNKLEVTAMRVPHSLYGQVLKIEFVENTNNKIYKVKAYNMPEYITEGYKNYRPNKYLGIGRYCSIQSVNEDGKLVFISNNIQREFGYMPKGETGYYIIYKNFVTFKDIQNHWAQTDIERMASYNLLYGVGNNLFSPSAYLTYKDACTLLERIFNETLPKEQPFTKSNPREPITREEFSWLLAEQIKKRTKLTTGSLDIFKDRQELSEYAKISTQQLVGSSILIGHNGYLYPKQPITRAEIIIILNRVIDKYN